MAKKFIFRLESVLNLRSHKVNEALEGLRSVVAVRLDKERELDERTEYYKSLNIIGDGHRIQVSEIQARFHHSNLVKEELINLDKEKKELLEIEEFRRQALSEAMKEEKILEKLKLKKHEVYLKDLLDEENKAIDALALSRYDKQDYLLK